MGVARRRPVPAGAAPTFAGDQDEGPDPPMTEVAPRRPSPPLIADPPHPGCRAVVVIPARDESATLGPALRHLHGQVGPDGRPLDRAIFEIIVLANNCRDGSAAVARSFGADHPRLALRVVEVELPPAEAHVGTARRLLMDEACRRLLAVGRPRGVIASTDADTRVDPSWIAATLAEVARGADAVGGEIRTDRAGRATLGARARRAYLADVLYRRLLAELEARVDPDPADPWPRHHHQTGASLAVTAEAYSLAGGLPPLRTSEDVALVRALRRLDRVVRHSPDVRVTTSARRQGRADGGMADSLRAWSDAGPLPRVESPARSEARYARTRRLRDRWRADGMEGRITFGAFLEGHEIATVAEDDAPIFEAIRALQRRLATLRGSDRPSTAALLEQVEPISLLASPAPVH